MEAEERPTKLRKLSHDLSPSEVSLSHPKDEPTPTRPELSTTQNPSASNSDSSSNILEIKEPAPPTNDHLTSDPTAGEITKHLPTELAATPGLSKNQLKKLKKKADWEAGREDRKALRREKDKAKKARRKAAREEELAKAAENKKGDSKQNGIDEKGSNISTWVPRRNYKFQQRPRVRVPIAFILDCSFDPLMTEKEIISLGSQLTRCYSDNTKSPYSAHFYISSWSPESELRKRFEGLMRGTYKNWKGIEFTEKDFVEAGKMSHTVMTGPNGGKMAGVFEKYIQDENATTESKPSATQNGDSIKTEQDEQATLLSTNESSHQPTPTGTHPSTSTSTPLPSSLPLPTTPGLIYLTSDSPHTLTHLTPHTTYIIGGLVDKNRHKSLCYSTAVRLGIPTAKLPLATYMKMTSREVLATNHVVEIMLRWLEVGEWGEAFLSVLPKRKGAVLRRGDGGEGAEEGGEGNSGNDEGDSDGFGEIDNENDIDHDNVSVKAEAI